MALEDLILNCKKCGFQFCGKSLSFSLLFFSSYFTLWKFCDFTNCHIYSSTVELHFCWVINSLVWGVAMGGGGMEEGREGRGNMPPQIPGAQGAPPHKQSCLIWIKWTSENLCPLQKARPHPSAPLPPTGKIPDMATWFSTVLVSTALRHVCMNIQLWNWNVQCTFNYCLCMFSFPMSTIVKSSYYRVDYKQLIELVALAKGSLINYPD